MTHDPIDVLGLSRLMRKRGHSSRARELYETALVLVCLAPWSGSRRWNWHNLRNANSIITRAISLWDAVREPCGSRRPEMAVRTEESEKALESAINAAEQLAIYYEHRAKEPRRALDLILAALSELQQAQRDAILAGGRLEKIKTRLDRRLQRLQRRCENVPPSARARSARQPSGIIA